MLARSGEFTVWTLNGHQGPPNEDAVAHFATWMNAAHEGHKAPLALALPSSLSALLLSRP